MNHSECVSLLDIAIRAALIAGEEVLSIYKSGDFEQYDKSDASPVTSADFKANDIITDILRKETPSIPIISEELNNSPLEERQHWTKYWLIDPIDGTQEFVSRSGDFAVNIALIENNKPVIGVIFWPVNNSLYYAQKGQGAFKKHNGEEHQIHIRQLQQPSTEELTLAISRRQSPELVTSMLNDMRSYRSVAVGSCSIKACFIAEGKADFYVRVGKTGEWDTGASQCIVSEAGGQILTTDFEPLTYNQRNSLINPDFVVLGDPNVNWQELIQY